MGGFVFFLIWTSAAFAAGVWLGPPLVKRYRASTSPAVKAVMSERDKVKADTLAQHQRADLFVQNTYGTDWIKYRCTCGAVVDHLYRDALEDTFKSHQRNMVDGALVRYDNNKRYLAREV